MQVLDRRVAGTASGEQVLRALTYLESYFVRRIVIGRATASLNRTLLQAVGAITDAAEIDVALRDYLSRGRKYYGTDSQVRDAVKNVPFYWQGRAAQKKLILQWLEESYGSKEAVDPKNLTIEHVLPQTLTDAVRDDFARGLPDGSDAAYEHDRIVHTIGNLTLTGYNSELSNRPFREKQPMLAESGLRMNQEIASLEVWGAAEIAQRSSDLAEKIIALWPGPNETLVGASSEEPSAIRRLVASIVAEIPAGRWTSYGEVALVAGSYPQPVAAVIASYPMQAAWRVLQTGGVLSPGFKWLDPDRTEDPREFLESEGLNFDRDGHADSEQFVDAEELAELTGLEIDPTRRRTSGTRPLLAQRKTFFQRVIDLGESTATVVTSWPSAPTTYGMDINFGVPGAVIVLSLTSRKPAAVFCALYIRDDEATFAHLRGRRDGIESAIGAELEWRDLPDNKSSQLILRRDGDWRDDQHAPELAQWLVNTADKFIEVFREYLSTDGR
jgi:alkylated DNA nucleotide flippase Atl1